MVPAEDTKDTAALRKYGSRHAVAPLMAVVVVGLVHKTALIYFRT